MTSAMTRLREIADTGDRAVVDRTAAALDGCESILDVGCGRASILERLPRRRHTVGIDGYLPAIEDSRSRDIHDEYVQGDVTQLEFDEDSFDAVIAFDLIEHLTKQQGLSLLADCERIARRSVVVFTPNGEVEQDEYDGNPLQAHQSGWTADDFRSAGYAVHGMKGYKALRGQHSTPRRPQTAARIALSLSQPVVEQRPQLAYSLLATKRF